jgi:sulfur relay (sulfurtransferase) DsrF/TusC family protein
LSYNDLRAERNCVAIVQAMEAILAAHAAGNPGGVVFVEDGGLILHSPGGANNVLYAGRV